MHGAFDFARTFDVFAPLLAIFDTIRERMGGDAKPADLLPYFPPTTQVEVMQETGHFIHIERPQETAGRILDFLRL